MTKEKEEEAEKTAEESKAPEIPKETVLAPPLPSTPGIPAEATITPGDVAPTSLPEETPQTNTPDGDQTPPPDVSPSEVIEAPPAPPTEAKGKKAPAKKGKDVPSVGDVVAFYTPTGPIKAEVIEVCNDNTVHLTHGEGFVNKVVQRGLTLGHWSW